MTNRFRYSVAHSREINEFHVRICPGRPTAITVGIAVVVSVHNNIILREQNGVHGQDIFCLRLSTKRFRRTRTRDDHKSLCPSVFHFFNHISI